MGLSKFEKTAIVLQVIIAVGSVIIATVALHIAHSERSASRYYRQIEHQPIIVSSYNADADDPDFDFIGYEIENRGPGYAIVAPMTILSPDGRYFNTPDSLESFLAGKPKNLRCWRNHGIMVFKPGEKKKILWIEKAEFDPEKDASTVAFLRKTTVVLPYCSLTGIQDIAFISGPADLMLDEKTINEIKAKSVDLFARAFEFQSKMKTPVSKDPAR